VTEKLLSPAFPYPSWPVDDRPRALGTKRHWWRLPMECSAPRLCTWHCSVHWRMHGYPAR